MQLRLPASGARVVEDGSSLLDCTLLREVLYKSAKNQTLFSHT